MHFRLKGHLVPSLTFVVLTADQLVGRDDGPPEQQKQDSRVCRRKRTFPLILRKVKILTTMRTNYKIKGLFEAMTILHDEVHASV